MGTPTAADIAAFIDARFEAMLSKPWMCATTPRSLEEQLMALDEVMAYAANNSASRYRDFLALRGYRTTPFTAEEASKTADRAGFESLVQFWREYLEWNAET